jgi:hypothetical protein
MQQTAAMRAKDFTTAQHAAFAGMRLAGTHATHQQRLMELEE